MFEKLEFGPAGAGEKGSSGEMTGSGASSPNQICTFATGDTISGSPPAVATGGLFQEPKSYVSSSQLPSPGPEPPQRRIYRGLSGIEREDSHLSVRQRRQQRILHGYPQFARFIGATRGYAIFRRFASLNARNLLYLQVELLELEDELDKIEEANSKDETFRPIQFSTVHLRAYRDHHRGDQQYKIVLLLREKLKQYSRCFPVL
jgi:hypothetical protein